MRKILLTTAIAVGMAVAGVPVISAVFGPDAAYANCGSGTATATATAAVAAVAARR